LGDPEHDSGGGTSWDYRSALTFLAAADYFLRGDIKSFREKIAEATRVWIGVFDRAAKGEPISDSFITVMNYMEVFIALAAGHFDLALELSQRMGNRDPKTEMK
jgi:hypothetical protein